MRRRHVLAGVATAAGLAGCGSLGGAGADDAIESLAFDVLDDGGTRAVADGPSVSFLPADSQVQVTGRFEAGNACRVPAVTGADYDAEADRLTVDVGTEPTGDLLTRLGPCPDGLQIADYRATVTFREDLPGSVAASERSAPGGQVRSTTVWRAQSD